ncbi:hypothetical protein AB2M62_07425 [Sphingomonas sp. MMS12-HWE2-04]|uniref:hypothetical protein n=1 Tax=Sphingomonas sp. MMS12-HWE2-04 TaxID=3234199 RepID=UPI00384E515A
MRKSGKPFARVRIFVGLTAAAVACAVTTAAAAQTEPSGQGPHIIVGSKACATRTAVSRILNALSFAAVSISIKDGKGTRVDVVFDETSTPVENLLSLYILRAAIDAVAGGQKSLLSYDIVLPNREKSEFSGATRILDDGVFAIAKALRFKAEGRERDFNIVSTGYTNEYLQICAKH